VRADPFAHLKERASQRANRTVDRIRAAIAALTAAGQKVTAESLKQATRDLEPGFAGLSFQVIRRNPRAYALYREAADAFTSPRQAEDQPAGKRRRRQSRRRRAPRSSYDPLQRLDKRELVQRIRALEQAVTAEQQRRAALAYDQQLVRAKIVRLETEVILLGTEVGPSQ
jgi:hypothetical protein